MTQNAQQNVPPETIVMVQLDDVRPPLKGPLTHEQASKEFLTIARSILNNYQKEKKAKGHVLCAILLGVTLIAGYFLTYSLGCLIEGIWLLLVVICNGGIHVRDLRLAQIETFTRLNNFLLKVERYGIYDQSVDFSVNLPTIAIARVYRDGKLKSIPCNLLVAGDILLIGFGEKSPAHVCHLYLGGQVELKRDQLLTPNLFPQEYEEKPIDGALFDCLYFFKVLESPIRKILLSSLKYDRPKTVISEHITILETMFNTRMAWGLIVFSTIINVLRVFLLANLIPLPFDQSFYYHVFAYFQVLSVIPGLPISLPFLLVISKSFGDAYILTLFDALQSSKTEFQDKEDVDEFDSAPAPTKDLKLSWSLILKKFLDQLLNVDGSPFARMTGFIESLANATVFCTIDREGTVSTAIPSVDQLFFIGPNGDPVILDVGYNPSVHQAGLKIEDAGWQIYQKMLKPLGFAHLVSTDCGILEGKRTYDLHFKSEKMAVNGLEIGCKLDTAKKYNTLIKFDTIAKDCADCNDRGLYHFEVPTMSTVIVSERDSSGPYQIFSEGSLDLMLDSCADYWDGEDLKPMNSIIKKKIEEFNQSSILSDLDVTAYGYRPIQNLVLKSKFDSLARDKPYYINLPKESVHNEALSRQASRLDTDDATTLQGLDVIEEATKSQTFLCATSFVYPPKPNMIDFVEDLALGGIRFVYFSYAPERESKAYAERLGLEIDWNSCIILSPDDGSGAGYLAVHDMNAKLPRGVDTIRDHIKNVDDVPLHVSLFAECTPPTIQEMMKIFQENGEVVCCIGTSLNDLNLDCFAIADVSIAIDPIALPVHTDGPISPLLVSAGFNTSACALTLHSDSRLYSITQMIRDARSLTENGRQAFAFYIGVQFGLSILVIVSYCCLIPAIFTGYQLMFIIWVLGPLISFTFLFTPHLPDIMTHMPAKNIDHQRDVPRFIIYYFLRFGTIPVISTIALFWLLVMALDSPSTKFGILFSREQSQEYLFIQNFVMFFYVVYLIAISSTFVHRIEPITSRSPLVNPVWIFGCVLTIFCQAAFFVISVPLELFTRVPWWIGLIAVAPIFIVVVINEVVKMHAREEWIRFQKRTKLEFNTKLGMHSPL